MSNKVYDRRILNLNDRPVDTGGDCVLYWMQRSQRASDNLALKFAADRANDLAKPLLVYFGLYDEYPMGSVRTFKFMLEGLRETAEALEERGIGFLLRREVPALGVVSAAEELGACAVIVDEDYLNIGRSWRRSAAAKLGVRLYQVDAETVVPARITDREEWGAYTFRPKITAALGDYFHEIPETRVEQKWTSGRLRGIDIAHSDPLRLASQLNVDQHVPPTPYFTGGTAEGLARLRRFIEQGLPRYKQERNEIGVSVSSDLSPYLHFGQVSALRTALTVERADAPDECIDTFLEQLIVRRELAINFCLHSCCYDKLDGAPEWAFRTLEAHAADMRPEIVELEDLEYALTDDDLWNAGQMELTKYGKMHPYMRMVWAKKLLEWSPTPEEAMARAIYLNDRYALDGRDPNGYTNIAWCIAGKHDRPFPERRVFGKVRCMSTQATKKKTHWRDYIARVEAI